MKKTLLTIAAALIAASSIAQNYSLNKAIENNSPLPQQKREISLRQLAKKPVMANNGLVLKTEGADTVTVNPPAGTLFENMYVNSNSYGLGWGSIYRQVVDGGIGGVVEGNDGNIYVKGPISQAYVWMLGSPWIKCEKAKGDTIVMHTPQMYAIDAADTYYIQRLIPSEDNTTFVVDTTETDIHFIWKNDTLEQVDDCLAGLTDATGSWFYMGDYNIEYTVNPDQVATIPSQSVSQTVQMIYKSDPTDTTKTSTKDLEMYANPDYDEDVDEGNPEIYLTNLESALLESPIKGTVEDLDEDTAKLVIPGGQYLGIDETYNSHIYAVTANARIDSSSDTPSFNYDLVPSITLKTFDEDSDTAKSVWPASLLINCGKNRLSIVSEYVVPVFAVKEYEAATPADPVFTADDVRHSTNFDLLHFTIPTVDVNGKDMNTNQLYYEIYLDDKPYTFTTDVFKGINHNMTEVPYNYADTNYDISRDDNGRYTIFFYDHNDYDSIGIQSIYKAGGETNVSKIVYVTNPVLGINGLHTDANASRPMAYYDITGRRISSDARGLVIVRRADGTVNKVINK